MIRFVAETGSTNDDMKMLAREGAPEGTWLRAERQTGGRGRMGRVWQGEGGNLFCSTLVRLGSRDPSPATLAFVAAVTVHEVLSDFVGANVLTIKWPNDIMANGAKLCGMLLERVDDAVIVGIGVNVVSAPELADRATTSLRALGASGADAASVLEPLANRFPEYMARWRTYGVEPVIRLWTERAHPRGTALLVKLPDGSTLGGQFESLDETGALILRLADGVRHAIHAGDVFLV